MSPEFVDFGILVTDFVNVSKSLMFEATCLSIKDI